MTRAYFAVFVAATLAIGLRSSPSHAQPGQGSAAGPARDTIAFVDITVLPMDRERVLTHQTVLVADGRITKMGSATGTSLPTSATRVDGRGKFLLPGFVDMHAHFLAGTEDLTTPAGRQLALYVANGFTTVRGLGGAPSALLLRARIDSGLVVGPRLVVASPSINGRSAKTTADVSRLVEAARVAGFDLVKTHGGFPDASFYDTLVAATKRAKLPLVGHVTPEFGLRRAMDAGQQIEHLDGFIAEIVDGGLPPQKDPQIIADSALLSHINAGKLARLAREMATRRLWNDPTLSLFEVATSDSTPEQYAQRLEMKYAAPGWAAQYAKQKAPMLTDFPANGRLALTAARRQIIRALYAAGAKLLIGSDSPQLFVLPGFGARDEMLAFVRAGLPPYAALEAATRNAAEFLGRSDDVGTVAVGKRADLVVLGGDPLKDIGNIARVDGVMLSGRWLAAPALASLIAPLETKP
ncbi:MAG: amidohydrolase family protein [bacterium]